MDALTFQSRYSKRILTKTSLTILSAVGDGESFGPGTTNGNNFDGYIGTVNVFTEKLNLHTSNDPKIATFLSRSASVVTLSATELSVIGNSNVLVATHGKPGVSNNAANAAGHDATNGSHGNRINLFIGKAGNSSTTGLTLDARGGDGATTANLKTPAGSGGLGGTIEVVGLSAFATLYEHLQRFKELFVLPENSSPEEAAASKPLAPGDEILMHARGLGALSLRSCLPGDPVGAKILGRLGIFLEDKPLSIFQVSRAVKSSLHFIQDSMLEESLRLHKACVVTGGRGGPATRTALERGTNGIDGKHGKVQLDFICTRKDMAPSFIFAHPLQCQMLLEKARAYFFFGDDASLKLARQTVEAALIKTGLFLQLSEEKRQAQIQLFKQQKSALGLDSTPNVLALFTEINQAGQNIMFQLDNTSLDYYSCRRNWVPRTSVSRFESEAQKALGDLKRIETLYLGYTKAVKELKQDATQREDILQEITTSQTTIDTHTEELSAVLADLKRSIQNPQTKLDIERMNKEVKYLLDELSHEVFTNFKLTPEQLLGAAKAIASEPSKETAAKEVGKLAWKGFTQIPNVEGVPVDKSLLFDKIDTINGSLKDNLSKLMQGIKSTDEGFLASDAGALIVVANSQQIEDMCNEFGSNAFGGKAKELAEKMRSFVGIVSQRNSDIVQYNVVLKDIVQSCNKKESLDGRRIAAQREGFKKEDLNQISAMADLAADMHNYSRERIMRLLTLYRRAIFFSTLSDPELLKIGGLKNDAALTLNLTKLEDIKTKLHDRLEALREKKGSDASRYPADYENAPGKFINLSARQLKELLEHKRLRMAIPVIRRDSQVYPDFRGRADVRVYRARFWLDGITVQDKSTWTEDQKQGDEIPVSIGLKHCGDSQFTDVYDQPHTFLHDEIDVTWQYRIYAPGIQIPKPQAVDSGDVVNYVAAVKEDNTAYAAPSPFATWIVSLEYLDSRVDLSKVTLGRFEFFGTSRSFK